MSRISRLLAALGLAAALTLMAATATEAEELDFSSEALQQATGELNRQLPMQLDPNHRLMQVRMGGRRLIYVIEVRGIRARDVKRGELATFARDKLGAAACGRSEVQMMFGGGISVAYEFVDPHGGTILDVELSPRDC